MLVLLVTALVGLAVPATADVGPLVNVTTSADSVTAGGTISLTVQFTNMQDTDIDFVYQSLSPSWATTQETGLDFAFTGCSGDVSWCDPTGQSTAWYDDPPIAPQATQDVTLTYQVAADSACGGGQQLGFDFYDYDEYNASTQNEFTLFIVFPSVAVLCS